MRSEAELKLDLIRIIDNTSGRKLDEIYDLIKSKFITKDANAQTSISEEIEAGYQQMAQDTERELAATEWLENTLDTTSL